MDIKAELLSSEWSRMQYEPTCWPLKLKHHVHVLWLSWTTPRQLIWKVKWAEWRAGAPVVPRAVSVSRLNQGIYIRNSRMQNNSAQKSRDLHKTRVAVYLSSTICCICKILDTDRQNDSYLLALSLYKCRTFLVFEFEFELCKTHYIHWKLCLEFATHAGFVWEVYAVFVKHGA